MNKTAIKNFAIWARQKLIEDISYKAGLIGVTEKGIKTPLSQSTRDIQFFDIGTKEPYSITGDEIRQREKLVKEIESKQVDSDYNTAYKSVIEEVAYTWFNRLIAVRFMEVNDYLPSRIRVLSSESEGKTEPDIVTTPFEADLEYTDLEKQTIVTFKGDNKLDELFRMLFIKQCNALNEVLPQLFEETSDYTELLLNISFTDKEGIVYHLVSDIDEYDFNVKEEEGQVEIIGWMYQYYNTVPKDETFALLKKNVKITKERIPAATQLFTPDWIVRYMVENSLGRMWVEGHPNEDLKKGWKYYLEEAEQEEEVKNQLEAIRAEYSQLKPEDIKVIDPCMGSGHILVYAFDVLMQIYESYGYSQRDAAKSIIENNIFGLDIDNRAYQLAYFAVMMKAREYNRRILSSGVKCNLYAIQESNEINRKHLEYFGSNLSPVERQTAIGEITELLDTMKDAREYGSIIDVKLFNKELLERFLEGHNAHEQMSFETVGIEETQEKLVKLIKIAYVMAQKYEVVSTNPPYMGNKNMNVKLTEYIQKEYSIAKSDIYSAFIIRCLKYARRGYLLSFISPYVWMYLSSFEEFRRFILGNTSISSLIQLEYNAFEVACVPVCTYTLRNINMNYVGRYIQLATFKGWENQEPRTLEAINNFNLDYCFEAKQNNYDLITGAPIAYWLSDCIYKIFSSADRVVDYGKPKQGLITGDNNRFMRIWFEVNREQIDFECKRSNESKATWFPHSKGGPVRRWYGNNTYIVNWKDNGKEIKNFKDERGKLRSRPQNEDSYFKKGITWSDLTISWFSARYVPEGFTFDGCGPTLFVSNHHDLKYICGYFNSWVFQEFLNITCQGMHYSNGIIGQLPIIMDKGEKRKEIEQLVSDNIKLSKEDWDESEISWEFKKHPIIVHKLSNFIKEDVNQYIANKKDNIEAMRKYESEINILFAKIYDMEDVKPTKGISKPTIELSSPEEIIKSFISYAIGCIFGRYSLDIEGLIYAGGDWDDSKYSTFIPDKNNIIPITDEEYFEDDIVGLFVTFVKKTFGEATLEENLDFIAEALGNKGNTSREIIRNYFIKDFFKDHCKVYQKRPIYWLFDSGKQNGFKALIYMHRYDENTIGNLRIDYLHKMQRIYDSEINRMQEMIANSGNAREIAVAEKRKEKLTKQLKEAREYDEKIAHLAVARIGIDLDDGVKVNYEKVQTGSDGKKLEVLAKI